MSTTAFGAPQQDARRVDARSWRSRRGPRAHSAFLLLLGAVLAASVFGCAHGSWGRGGPLRVGVAPHYPPIVAEQDGGLIGLEVDLARALGERLGRKIDFVRVERSELIPALEADRIDIVMSGMSITEERSARVLFTDPYLRVGQLALIRVDDLGRLSSANAFRRSGVRVGYIDGTTGEAYVTNELPNSESYAFATVDDGVRNLRAGRLDILIHDAPTVWRIGAGIDENELMGLYRPLTEEYLAWAVRPADAELAAALNETLAEWKTSGDLDRVLNRWIPVRVEVRP